MSTLATPQQRELLEPQDRIAGGWTRPGEVLDGWLCDPATGEPLQQQVATASAHVDEAVGAAWDVHLQDPLGIGIPDQRAEALHRVADLLEEVAERIAVQDALNSGVPVAVTRLFAASLGGTFRGAAGQMAALADTDLSECDRTVHLHRLPLGPAAVLAPWNAPTAVAGKKAAYAWAAGCPVIVKPSPWSPNGTRLLVEAMVSAAQSVGLPPASVQLVHGDAHVGRQLAADSRVRALSFTGSRSGGRAVAAAASGDLKALQLELGSNNPAIVLDDADLDLTAAALVAGMTKLNGAWCESPGTVFVPARLLDALLGKLRDGLTALVVGDPLDERATFGPQANPVQRATLDARLEELLRAGARVEPVGAVPEQGFWLAPTLVTDAPEQLVRDELFGPVLVLRPYEQVGDAVAAAHRLHTGLAGYVFTGSVTEGLRIGRLLPAGEVKVNGTSLLDMSPRSAQAFWYGSGIGGHGDRDLARFFTGARIVGVDVDSPL